MIYIKKAFPVTHSLASKWVWHLYMYMGHLKSMCVTTIAQKDRQCVCRMHTPHTHVHDLTGCVHVDTHVQREWSICLKAIQVNRTLPPVYGRMAPDPHAY